MHTEIEGVHSMNLTYQQKVYKNIPKLKIVCAPVASFRFGPALPGHGGEHPHFVPPSLPCAAWVGPPSHGLGRGHHVSNLVLNSKQVYSMRQGPSVVSDTFLSNIHASKVKTLLQ